MRSVSRPPLARVVRIDAAVRADRSPNARTLADELEVAPRTVQRDMEFMLDQLGAPLVYNRARHGYSYSEPSYRLPLYQLTEGELIAILLAERLLQEHRHTTYAAALAEAFRKMTAGLPEKVTIDLAHLAGAFAVRHQAIEPTDVARFTELVRAIGAGRQLELLYWTASRDDTARRVVDPYHLASVEGDWFLVGYCHLREEVLMFAPSRIRELKETGARFERPPDFRIADYLDAGFRAMRGTGPPRAVRLRFRPAAARYIRERQWHRTQVLQDEPDGSLILTLRINHTLEVKRLALSWGADCEVLEPVELRDEIKQELNRMAEAYANRLP